MNYDSIYAEKKTRRMSTLRISKFGKKMITELVAGIQCPTLEEVKSKLHVTEDKARIILQSIKQKRKALSEHTGLPLPGQHKNGEEGFVYLIKNPSFPGWVKCGMTTSCGDRLKSYNGYDPTEGFSFIATKAVKNRRTAERQLLEKVAEIATDQKGEWFKVCEEESLKILNEI